MLTLTMERQSWAHRVPVGRKLSVLFVLTLLVFPVADPVVLVAILLGVAGFYATLGRRGFGQGLWSLRPILWFAVLILGYHLLVGRFEQGLAIVLKMVALVGAANFVTLTSRTSDMMALVIWVLRPFPKLGRRIALAFALVIRFTPDLIGRGALLSMAWRARSARPVGWRIVAPLAVTTLDDGEQIATALRARGGIE